MSLLAQAKHRLTHVLVIRFPPSWQVRYRAVLKGPQGLGMEFHLVRVIGKVVTIPQTDGIQVGRWW